MKLSPNHNEKDTKAQILSPTINVPKEEVDTVTMVENFYNNTTNRQNISLEECVKIYDDANFQILTFDNSVNYSKLKKYFQNALLCTPQNLQAIYGKEVIKIIGNMKKSYLVKDLPQLPYGKSLSDLEFINLLRECVLYANFNLDKNSIDYIRDTLIGNYTDVLQNIFTHSQYKKDIYENAILTILTSKKRTDQDDNFRLLEINLVTKTPFIKLDFNDDEYKLDINELKMTFCSHVYLENYQKTLKDFIPEHNNLIDQKDLQKYINNYFDNHFIHFCDLPENIYAVIIHSGNIYLKLKYLYEYFNKTNKDAQLLIREKIILNIGHELMHALLREISPSMQKNFLITSNNKNNKFKKSKIPFKHKFKNKIKLFNPNESGNAFDFNFFNSYYFTDIFSKEAEFFLSIKKYNSMDNYKDDLNKIINEEKSLNINLYKDNVNKFKSFGDEDDEPRICIKSRLFNPDEE